MDIRPSLMEVSGNIGTTIKLTYTVRDANGNVVDLSSATSKVLVKYSSMDSDSEAVAEFEVDGSNALNGEFTIILPATSSASLKPGVYYADHRASISSGDYAGEYIVARVILYLTKPITFSTT